MKSKDKHKYNADDIEYCLMLVTSSLRLIGGLRDEGILEDDLKDFSLSLIHFVDPIIYEIKKDVLKYRGINQYPLKTQTERSKKDDKFKYWCLLKQRWNKGI